MKFRSALLFAVAVTFICVSQTEASAAGRRGRVSQPTFTSSAPTTILPSREEIAAVPAPGQGRLVGYALTIHPGARVARMIIGR